MYIKKQQGIPAIPAELKQTFANKFTLNIGKTEIIKRKNNNNLTERDVKIAKFLFQFRFATAEQIHSFLNEQSSIENLRGRLEKLTHSRILNKFMLGDYEQDEIPTDAFEVYCLDLGGRYLLTNFSNEDTTDWYSAINMVSSEIVNKTLFTVDFYLRLRETMGNRLIYFKAEPIYRCGKKTIIPSFNFCIKDGSINRNYIGEIVRDFDFPLYAREKAEKLEQLLMTNAWKKYFYEDLEPPVLFVFTENDHNALEVGKLYACTTEIERFRISTNERIQIPLHEGGAFLKYVVESNMLKKVKSSTFAPITNTEQ
ncbi:hypothetical protein ABD91_25710 [Lysinibacillus sphaericus]|uniref:hypothetical protein n=1 Tax=Lysinibacillus sphaericus TaxID=1421 RepID=UPI0018CD0AA2|nr:hypothetical protein [Lysinibacillus sphaericus]MBG9694139.1 hypothetical protein [Lysinibacillus sphaericus]